MVKGKYTFDWHHLLFFSFSPFPCSLDVWSAGCVLAELLLGQPIFPGDSGVDQLVEIIKVATETTYSLYILYQWVCFSSTSERECFVKSHLVIFLRRFLARQPESRSERWTPTTQSSNSPRSRHILGVRWVNRYKSPFYFSKIHCVYCSSPCLWCQHATQTAIQPHHIPNSPTPALHF